MLSELKRGLILLSIVPALSLGGCGILGEKAPLDKVLRFAADSSGCLNEFGPATERYLKGEIAPSEWEEVWDCAIDAIGLFRDFVKASSDKGYTHEDIKGFISGFLFTEDEIPEALVAASFDLKASIFGGSTEFISSDELDLLLEMLKVGKIESLALIEHLSARRQDPRPPVLFRLQQAIASAGRNIGAKLGQGGGFVFPVESGRKLLSGLAKLNDWEIPENWVNATMASKAILTGGSKSGIASWEWARLFTLAGEVGGAALAIVTLEGEKLTAPNGYLEFLMKMADTVKPAFDNAVDLHGTGISMDLIDDLLVSLPSDFLPVEAPVVGRMLRPLVYKLLRSGREGYVTKNSVSEVFRLMRLIVKGQTMLDRIYLEFGLDPMGASRQSILEAADVLRTRLKPEQIIHLERVLSIVREYRPLFRGNDPQISFSENIKYSRHNVSMIHWINLIVRQILQTYGTVEGKLLGTVGDLKSLIDDYVEFGHALHVLQDDIPNVEERRFSEADYFTFASNGDGFLDLKEATYYMASLISASNLARVRIIGNINPVCGGHTLDPLGIPWMDIGCFRAEFFSRFESYIDYFPALARVYRRLLKDGKEEGFHSLVEKVTRRYGTEGKNADLPLATFDVDAIGGIFHYTETVFQRFDENGDEVINLKEAFKAFPTFRSLLVKASDGTIKPDQTFLLKAAFTFILRFGKDPQKDKARFILWILWRPFWTVEADRVALFKVFAALAKPDPLPDQDSPKYPGNGPPAP